MRISLRTYSLISTVATGAMVYHAYNKYHQFYPAGVYLATAKHSLLLFANMLVILAYFIGKLVVYLFLDKVQERESEYVNDRLKSSITDTILALTIFREHFNSQFIFLFLLLLFFQVFHWLTKNRVEYIEHTPYNFFNQIKLGALLLQLLVGDIVFIYYASVSLLKEGPNIMILFGLEFGLLLVTNISTLITLFINIEGIKREGRWDNKGLYILYLEFGTETCKAVLYLIFFGVTLLYYGLPIHIIRQIFISLKTSIRRFNDIRQYRNITNERFPDATEEELNHTDRICIVCREDMSNGKKLPCGHILHLGCLRSWLERQQSCPICRADVLVDEPRQPPARPAAAQPPPAQAAAAQPEAQPQQHQQQPGAAHPFQFGNIRIHGQVNQHIRDLLLQNMRLQIQQQQQQQINNINNNNNNNNNQPIVPPITPVSPTNTPTFNQNNFQSVMNNNQQLLNQALYNVQQQQQPQSSSSSPAGTESPLNPNINNNNSNVFNSSDYNPTIHLMFIQQHLQYLMYQTQILSNHLTAQNNINHLNSINNNNNNSNNNSNQNNNDITTPIPTEEVPQQSPPLSNNTTSTTSTSINQVEQTEDKPSIEEFDGQVPTTTTTSILKASPVQEEEEQDRTPTISSDSTPPTLDEEKKSDDNNDDFNEQLRRRRLSMRDKKE